MVETQPTADAFLRIPPFPGAATAALADGAVATTLSVQQANHVAAMLSELRVGGAYWADRPSLPAKPYRLMVLEPARYDLQCDDGERVAIMGECDPWHLVSRASEVIAAGDDELLLVAALSGVPICCKDSGRFSALASGGREALWQAVNASILGFAYSDPFTGDDIDAATAIELCGFWRDLIDSNRCLRAAVGFGFWKQPTVAPLLWSGRDLAFVNEAPDLRNGQTIAVWRSRTAPKTLDALERNSAKVAEVEDGFIRSAGLGADCVPPLSIVVDHQGIYFDPGRPSDLERLLIEGEFDQPTLLRARRLRELIIDLGVSKYSAGGAPLRRRGDEAHVLVPGQVEDDRSVLSGGGDVRTNADLLRRVRAERPDAYIMYKPHPDVEAGHRIGAIPDQVALSIADEVIRDQPITAVIAVADEVHVNTSLAGFEALLRSKLVATYGVPFYAGWGLTADHGPVPARRNVKRTVDELVAAALLRYPRYLDPETGLPCPPEILIRRLADGRGSSPEGMVVRLRRLQGRTKRVASALKFWR